jgi:hypothetical protein
MLHGAGNSELIEIASSLALVKDGCDNRSLDDDLSLPLPLL